MENCTIYSHHLKFDEIAQIVKTTLPKAKVEVQDGGKQKGLIATLKGGFFGKTKQLKINYRERENPSYKLDKVECGLTQNLAGMVNYVQSFPASKEDVRNKFLHKVMATNCEMAFMAEPEIGPEFQSVLQKIITETDAFVFAQPNSVFRKSSSQHFLDKDLNLIIDAGGNMEVNDVSVSVDAKYHDEPKDNYTEEQLARKAQSESVLNSHAIKVNANLPCTAASTDIILRTKEEVIDRVYALMAVAVYGEGITKEQLQKLLADKNINTLTSKEKALFDLETLDDQQRAHATWRYESLYTLLWALRGFEELKYPAEICDVKEVVSKLFKPSREAFAAEAQLRSVTEILDELDKTYRMNWACVDARINGQAVGGGINPSVIYERHYALNWLTQYQNQDWDNVQTNT